MPTLIQNKKVNLNYEIMEKYDAGLSLRGYEVKSIRNKHGSLEGSYIIVRGNEAFLIGARIPPYQASNTPAGYAPYRNRKLLLTKKEISELSGFEKKKGLTIIPIMLYTKGHNIKLSLGIGRGKKKYDKRETIKKKDTLRDVARELKERGY